MYCIPRRRRTTGMRLWYSTVQSHKEQSPDRAFGADGENLVTLSDARSLRGARPLGLFCELQLSAGRGCGTIRSKRRKTRAVQYSTVQYCCLQLFSHGVRLKRLASCAQKSVPSARRKRQSSTVGPALHGQTSTSYLADMRIQCSNLQYSTVASSPWPRTRFSWTGAPARGVQLCCACRFTTFD